MNLAEIGFTKDELQDRLIERISSELLESVFTDEEGDGVSQPSQFKRKLQKHIEDQISKKIDDLAQVHVLPNITTYLENICLQKTNEWGEKVGKPLSFVEYLVSRADAYMREEVNFQGKTKGQDSYGWKASGTRVSYLIHQHLHYTIENAMKKAIQDANNSIVGGLEAAVKVSLDEIRSKLSVSVQTR